ncbi:MAG: Mur ligase family protein [Bacteroidota bacterium]|nr:Mur ligase family protein [Bacteroidota bacterium]
MKVHFIAIGGSAMHNLAIALHKKGFIVTGSDDEIFEPAKSNLNKYGLLPSEIGWHPEILDESYDAIILGMHAREDNPELIKAKETGLKIFSYPEYIYEQSKNKKRVVIGGSHGKTTITAMIIHVLRKAGIDTDYLVGAQLEGFETMVKISNDAPVIILEGDEYLTSPIDKRPKFHLYKPHLALLSGIAWDHINVFPTFEEYYKQFLTFANTIEDNGILTYFTDDLNLQRVSKESKSNIEKIPYQTHQFTIKDGITYLTDRGQLNVPIKVFGKHNLQNISGAKVICNNLGINDDTFYNAISSFPGASKRLETVYKNDNFIFYRDFAHSPSKLSATASAVKQQYPEKELTACIELHTFSSLNKTFLKEYFGTMNEPDIAVVYFNPETIEHKKLESISIEDIKVAFGRKDIIVFNKSSELLQFLKSKSWKNRILLMMSSGNFDGINMFDLANEFENLKIC